MIEQFSIWFQSKQREIEHISAILAMQISSESRELIDDLSVIECWYQRVGEMLAEANAWLDKARRYYLPDNTEDMREADRKAIVDERCADIKKVRNIIESQMEAIKQRLILGESVLRYERSFPEAQLKGDGNERSKSV